MKRCQREIVERSIVEGAWQPGGSALPYWRTVTDRTLVRWCDDTLISQVTKYIFATRSQLAHLHRVSII